MPVEMSQVPKYRNCDMTDSDPCVRNVIFFNFFFFVNNTDISGTTDRVAEFISIKYFEFLIYVIM